MLAEEARNRLAHRFKIQRLMQVLGAAVPCVPRAGIFTPRNASSGATARAREWYEKILTFEGTLDDTGEMSEARNYINSCA